MTICTPIQNESGSRIVFGRLEADLSRLPSHPKAENTGKAAGHLPAALPVFYLGYPLYLSSAERSLMRVLLETAVTPGSDGWVAASLLRSRLGLSEEQIAVHVLRINRKAAEIGGRKLIVSHKGLGYRLNPYM